MTIGIGVLASSNQRATDTLILLADTKGTFAATHSMNRLHKIFTQPALGIHAVAADQIDRAGELFGIITNLLNRSQARFPVGDYGNLMDTLHAASDIYKRKRFRFDVLPQHAYPASSLTDEFRESDLTPQLLRKWRKFYFGCQMILGAFSTDGQVNLFLVDGVGGITSFTFPGFAAIGSGSQNAMFWLTYRNHHLGLSPKHAAYHAYEAKVMAESSPFVNEKLDLLIATKEHCHSMTDFNPATAEVPFTLDELRALFGKYGPKSTNDFDAEGKAGLGGFSE